jgi:lysophospholipase L1-like esterase
MKIVFLGDSLTEGTIGVSYFDIIKNNIPQHNLLNYGRNGEPVVGLYNRMKKIDYNNADIAFIWIGTNDIFVKINWTYPIIKSFLNKPWAKDHKEFKLYYKRILEKMQNNVKKIFTISLWFIGEDFNNKWNKELDEYSDIIRRISKDFNNVEYIDLRKVFVSKFSTKKVTKFLPNSNSRLFFDSLTIRNAEQSDEKSTERGLQFTADGVHLNSVSANIVAYLFTKKILKFSNTEL